MRSGSYFSDFEDARISAGIFVSDAIKMMGISERTYFRWKAQRRVPYWALAFMESRSGDLGFLGWEKWRIVGGVLYHDELHRGYYHWSPEELLVDRLIHNQPAPIWESDGREPIEVRATHLVPRVRGLDEAV